MMSECFNERKACFPDRAYTGSVISPVGEPADIPGHPLLEYLTKEPIQAPDSPVPMPYRHGFPKNRHGFCSRGVVFTSENEIRE